MSHAKAFVEAHGSRETLNKDTYQQFLASILPEGTSIEDNMEAARGSRFSFPDGTEAKTQPSEDDVSQLIALICGSEANGEGDDADEDSEDDESEDEDVSEDESEDA